MESSRDHFFSSLSFFPIIEVRSPRRRWSSINSKRSSLRAARFVSIERILCTRPSPPYLATPRFAFFPVPFFRRVARIYIHIYIEHQSPRIICVLIITRTVRGRTCVHVPWYPRSLWTTIRKHCLPERGRVSATTTPPFPSLLRRWQTPLMRYQPFLLPSPRHSFRVSRWRVSSILLLLHSRASWAPFCGDTRTTKLLISGIERAFFFPALLSLFLFHPQERFPRHVHESRVYRRRRRRVDIVVDATEVADKDLANCSVKIGAKRKWRVIYNGLRYDGLTWNSNSFQVFELKKGEGARLILEGAWSFSHYYYYYNCCYYYYHGTNIHSLNYIRGSRFFFPANEIRYCACTKLRKM